MEQLGWIPLADEWLELRRIRNEFAHDYPENPELHPARLRHAMAAGQRLMEILGAIVSRKNGGLAVEMSRGLQVIPFLFQNIWERGHLGRSRAGETPGLPRMVLVLIEKWNKLGLFNIFSRRKGLIFC